MEFAPPPRSCEVTKWPEVRGYGFTLHNNKDTRLQLIGKVDPGSPAEAAGLKPKDIIIEINGTNVTRESHKQIVERIKSSGESTTFLVVDQECKDYHDQHGNVISSSMPNVVHLSSARADSRKSSSASSSQSVDEGHESEEEEIVEKKQTNEENVALETVQEDNEKDSSDDDSDEDEIQDTTVHQNKINEKDNQLNKNGKAASVSESSSASSSDDEEEEKENITPMTPVKDPEPTFKPPPPMRSKRNSSQEQQRTSQRSSYNKNEMVAGLSLNLSAKEMREKLKDEAQRDSWKRNDQRFTKGMSFKDKVKYVKDLGKKQIN